MLMIQGNIRKTGTLWQQWLKKYTVYISPLCYNDRHVHQSEKTHFIIYADGNRSIEAVFGISGSLSPDNTEKGNAPESRYA